MSLKSLNCPRCNAAQSSPVGWAPGQRVKCGGCGETFSVNDSLGDPGEGAPSPRRAKARGQSKWAAVGIGVGVVLVIGSLGAAYVLMTRDFRPEKSASQTGKPREWPVDLDAVNEDPTPPARMEGLGYLPTTANVVACAYIRDLRFQIMASNLLRKPLAVGTMKLKLEDLARWSGLTLREMDHVLLAASFGAEEANSPSPLTLVVRTVLEHDQEKVRKTMKAKEPVTSAGADGIERALREATLGSLPVRLFQPDNRTLVIGLFDGEMKQVPGRPHEGAKRLRPELRDTLEKRLLGAPGLWAVGHSTDWSKTPVPGLFRGLEPAGPLIGQFARFRTVAVAMTSWGRDGGHLLWQVEAADATAARDIETTVLAPRAKEGRGGPTYSREGAWITARLTVDTGPPPGPGTKMWGAAPAPRQPGRLAVRTAFPSHFAGGG